MNWWRRLRRWLGFPGFDYEVDADLNFVTRFQLNAMTPIVREEVRNWCDKHFAQNQWCVEFFEEHYDLGPMRIKFKFKHKKHAMHFKLAWGK